jgi:hypothetical protein
MKTPGHAGHNRGTPPRHVRSATDDLRVRPGNRPGGTAVAQPGPLRSAALREQLELLPRRGCSRQRERTRLRRARPGGGPERPAARVRLGDGVRPAARRRNRLRPGASRLRGHHRTASVPRNVPRLVRGGAPCTTTGSTAGTANSAAGAANRLAPGGRPLPRRDHGRPRYRRPALAPASASTADNRSNRPFIASG